MINHSFIYFLICFMLLFTGRWFMNLVCVIQRVCCGGKPPTRWLCVYGLHIQSFLTHLVPTGLLIYYGWKSKRIKWLFLCLVLKIEPVLWGFIGRFGRDGKKLFHILFSFPLIFFTSVLPLSRSYHVSQVFFVHVAFFKPQYFRFRIFSSIIWHPFLHLQNPVVH